MTDKVLMTIEAYQMLSDCHTLGIGLSGGADSVCLAHILSANKDKLGVSVIKGIHIHHGIRGDEADRDLEFSRKICEKFDINENWLRFGSGVKKKEKTENDELAYMVGALFAENNGFKMKIIKAMLTLEDEDWYFIEKLINKFTK